ncbi:MAG: hypothetical protein IJA95_07040 [Bacteroidaceae bacterium]|nr:hypothetical protein [Bacteroidaceae bacterium]
MQKKGYPLQKVYKNNGDRPLFYDWQIEHHGWSQCDAWYIPTLWDAKLWLIEKVLEVVAYYSNWNQSWRYDVNDVSKSTDSILEFGNDYRKFTEALQAGIMKSLEFLPSLEEPTNNEKS